MCSDSTGLERLRATMYVEPRMKGAGVIAEQSAMLRAVVGVLGGVGTHRNQLSTRVQVSVVMIRDERLCFDFF